MMTREQAIQKIEAGTNVRVDHILMPQISQFDGIFGVSQTKMYSPSQHFMDKDGVELGYFCEGFDSVRIFEEGRIWDGETIKNAKRVELTR